VGQDFSAIKNLKMVVKSCGVPAGIWYQKLNAWRGDDLKTPDEKLERTKGIEPLLGAGKAPVLVELRPL
jgi:hypothetical protein